MAQELSTKLKTHEVRFYTDDTKERLVSRYVTRQEAIMLGEQRNLRHFVTVPGYGALPPELVRGIFPIDKKKLEELSKPKKFIAKTTTEIKDGKKIEIREIKTYDPDTREILKTETETKVLETYTPEQVKRYKLIANLCREARQRGEKINYLVILKRANEIKSKNPKHNPRKTITTQQKKQAETLRKIALGSFRFIEFEEANPNARKAIMLKSRRLITTVGFSLESRLKIQKYYLQKIYNYAHKKNDLITQKKVLKIAKEKKFDLNLKEN